MSACVVVDGILRGRWRFALDALGQSVPRFMSACVVVDGILWGRRIGGMACHRWRLAVVQPRRVGRRATPAQHIDGRERGQRMFAGRHAVGAMNRRAAGKMKVAQGVTPQWVWVTVAKPSISATPEIESLKTTKPASCGTGFGSLEIERRIKRRSSVWSCGGAGRCRSGPGRAGRERTVPARCWRLPRRKRRSGCRSWCRSS